MPELPDVVTYIEALRPRIVGQRLLRVRLTSPFVLRSVDPPLSAVHGKNVIEITRLGKRIVWEVEDGLFLLFHLMIAGRLRWRDAGSKIPGKLGLAAFDFLNGTLLLTEAGTKKRAALHLVRGKDPFDLKLIIADDPRGPGVYWARSDMRGGDLDPAAALAR